ncbi:2308_t:CDS:2 [Diversispora eburnea]|uniref:2308_t:CDS:1 n=1 Tax=Diversispora eburnea TaxID=1213867 RepID=A0A9N9ATB1_9GLOM|nr:2308_t:CDS:2 [Diversispora eburnea]
MPSRKQVSTESTSIPTELSPQSSSAESSSQILNSLNGTSTSSIYKSSEKSSLNVEEEKIDLVFSKKHTFPLIRSRINYEKLAKFIEETLRYINTFNYPYEMFYRDLNGKEQVLNSRIDDTMKELKEICATDRGKDVKAVYILADKKVGIQTFLTYNLDFLVFLIFLTNLLWFIFVGSDESKVSLYVLGLGLLFRMYYKYLKE